MSYYERDEIGETAVPSLLFLSSNERSKRMNTLKHILKIGGIAGAIISGVAGVMDAIGTTKEDSLEDRVAALEKKLSERSK